jgi:hypothetical protein
VAELMELSGQLLRAWLAVQGRHRPTLEDMELSDRLAAYVLAERRTSRRRSLPARAAA